MTPPSLKTVLIELAGEHAEKAAHLEDEARRRAAEGKSFDPPNVVDLFERARRERQLGHAAKALADGIRF